MKVLVIDDDEDVADFLSRHLPARGFAVDTARDGGSGAALARMNAYDLVVLDLNLPDMPGERVIESLRCASDAPPILMLTVITDVPSKVRILNAGADDYLVKPFAFDELIARMRALLRRPSTALPAVIVVRDLEIDVARQAARRGKKGIALTRKEFALLEYLARSHGAVVSRGTLIEHAWDSSADPLSNSIETHMANLRRKLGSPDIIRTVHGRGYSLG